MIALIGKGYIGSAFADELDRRNSQFTVIHHGQVDSFWKAHQLFKELKPELVINCAAFIPAQSVQLCDTHQEETIKGNVVFPVNLCHAAADQGIPFAHISTGCLWNDGREHLESDSPQRAFTGHCGFYIGTKVVADDTVRTYASHFIWRVRLPFDRYDTPRNYLSKLRDFKQVWDQRNSLCHRRDFVKACLDLWERRAPFGTYNMTNPGSASAREILGMMQSSGKIKELPEIINKTDGQCLLNPSKLLSAGVKIRHVDEALWESVKNFG